MSKFYHGIMCGAGLCIGAILIVLSWGVGAVAYGQRRLTGRWPEWFTSRDES